MEQSATKRIAKNFSWLLAGNIASGLINFFAIVYIARVLGAANYGLVQIAQAFLLYLVIIVDSGLSTYGTKEIAQDRTRAPVISINIFALRFALALVVFGLSLLVILFIPIDPTLRLLFTATFLLVFYRALNTDWVFQGLEKMEFVGLFKFAFAAVSFCFIVVLVRQPADLVNVPLVHFAAGAVISSLFIIFLFKKILPFKLNELSLRSWPGAFWVAIPLGISTILLQIYDNLDTIMLGLMDRAAVVGLYNAAYRIFYLFAGVFSLWLMTILPVACSKMAADRAAAGKFLEKYLRLTLLFFIPITVFVFLAAPLFIQIVFGSEYVRSALALRWLIWALIPLAISNSYGSLVLIPAGLFNKFLLSVGAGALANVALNFILIPRFSMIGAAAATIIAQIVAGMIAFVFAQNIVRLHFGRCLIKPVGIALLAAAAFLFVHQLFAGQDQVARSLISSLVFLSVSGIAFVYLEYEFIATFAREIMNK